MALEHDVVAEKHTYSQNFGCGRRNHGSARQGAWPKAEFAIVKLLCSRVIKRSHNRWLQIFEGSLFYATG
jgi:hypothetical protein